MSKISKEFTKTQEQTKLRQREINPISNPKDRIVARLGATGRSNFMIRALTGYSDGQIGYRLRAWDIHRNDYRNGIVRPYTRMHLRIHNTEEFLNGLEQHLRAAVPHIFNKQK